MNRDVAIQAISDRSMVWDCLVIGGGATGLGTALEAASRGYRTLLVEKTDFAKGTSSRATKLVHGGVRYLEQGNIALVREALHERGLLLRHASHLAHPLKFVIPAYHYWQLPFYGVGLKIYDALSGKLSLGKSEVFGPSKTVDYLPNVETKNLKGGILYLDGQFDDARLTVSLLQSIHDAGGVAANYVEVVRLTKDGTKVNGAVIRDRETGQEQTVRAKAVVNATGIFTDVIRELDDPAGEKIIAVAQGSHLVLPKEFLQSKAALMVPKTSDGRVLFAIPWHDRLIIGTTDFGVPKPVEEPRIQDHEINFILSEAARYMAKDPTESDVLACYSGLRPLVKAGHEQKTAALSRSHSVIVSSSGLVTITGGKWTTYRHMGEDCINRVTEVAGLEARPSKTAELPIHGNSSAPETFYPPEHLAVYGTDRKAVEQSAGGDPLKAEKLHPKLPYLVAEVHWAIENEMARTAEDILSRRTRSLLLDAKAAIEVAPRVAKILADKLQRDKKWVDEQVSSFNDVAQNYVLRR
ncbi:MAG: glycerol-3-phosphate dehydrogenase/oxidase [Chthoniobacterales bacterium]